MTRGRPERIIPLESVARVATKLQKRRIHTNIAAIARFMNVPRRTLADHLKDDRELMAQLGIERCTGKSWMTNDIHAQYRRAARAIKKAGGLPSVLSLSQALGFRRKRIVRYLREHRALALQLGIVDDYAGLVFQAGSDMLNAEVPVTRTALAAQAGICYAKLAKVLKTHPEFVKRLKISRASYGTAGWNSKEIVRAHKLRPAQSKVGQNRYVEFMSITETEPCELSLEMIIETTSSILGISVGRMLSGSANDAVADARGIVILLGKALDPEWSRSLMYSRFNTDETALKHATERISKALKNPHRNMSCVVRVWLVCTAFSIRPNRLLTA